MKDAHDSRGERDPLALVFGLVAIVFILTFMALGFLFGGIEHAPLP